MFGKKKSKHAFSHYSDMGLTMENVNDNVTVENEDEVIEESPDDIYIPSSTAAAEEEEEQVEIDVVEQQPQKQQQPQQPQQKYKLDPHEAPLIDDSDIGFILKTLDKTVEDDYMMKEIYKSADVSCHIYSGEKFDLGRADTKRMIIIKTVGILYYDLSCVMNTIMDSSLVDSAMQEANVDITRVERSPSDNKGYSLSITRRTMFYKTIEHHLDFCLANTAVYDPHRNRFLIVSKSCTHPKVQQLKHLKSKRSFTLSGRIYDSIGDHLTRYTEVTFVNYSDFNKKDLIKKAYMTHALDYHMNFVSRLNANFSKGFPAPKYTHGVYSTLLDFEKNYLDQVITSGVCPWEKHVQSFAL